MHNNCLISKPVSCLVFYLSLLYTMFSKLAIGVAFSPRFESILYEAKRFQEIFNAKLVLIHVGLKTEDKERLLHQKLVEIGYDQNNIKIIWEKGDPAKMILSVCKQEKVDLLIAGAMKKENIFKYYIGSVARKILRKADCSVLMLVHPSKSPSAFKKIVINGSENENLRSAISKGVRLGQIEQAARVYILREVKMFGFAMAVAGEEGTENEYVGIKRRMVEEEIIRVNQILKYIDTSNLKINVKVITGKPEFEIAKFSRKVKADLLVLGAPVHKLNLIDRIFPHDMEYLLADLPSNLLVIHN